MKCKRDYKTAPQAQQTINEQSTINGQPTGHQDISQPIFPRHGEFTLQRLDLILLLPLDATQIVNPAISRKNDIGQLHVQALELPLNILPSFR